MSGVAGLTEPAKEQIHKPSFARRREGWWGSAGNWWYILLTGWHLPRPSTCQGQARSPLRSGSCTHPCLLPAQSLPPSSTPKQSLGALLQMEWRKGPAPQARSGSPLPPVPAHCAAPAILTRQGRRRSELYLRIRPSLTPYWSAPTSRSPALPSPPKRARLRRLNACHSQTCFSSPLPAALLGTSALRAPPPPRCHGYIPPPPGTADWSDWDGGRRWLAATETRSRRRAGRRGALREYAKEHGGAWAKRDVALYYAGGKAAPLSSLAFTEKPVEQDLDRWGVVPGMGPRDRFPLGRWPAPSARRRVRDGLSGPFSPTGLAGI